MKEKYIQDDFCNICPLMVKRYFNIQDLENIIENHIPTLNYTVRGIYFIPLINKHRKLLYLFSDREKKSKDKNKKFISFQIEKTMNPDVYDLYLNNNGMKKKHDIASVPNYEKSVFLNELFKNHIDETKPIYVECEYNQKFKKWEPLRTSKYLSNTGDL